MNLFAQCGPWAVITGASSGLGEQFARQLAPLGFHLALVARRSERLEALATELRNAHGIQCRVIPLDLASPDADGALDSATKDLDVGLFVNNAGRGYYGTFLKQDRKRLAELIQLNCHAVAMLAHRFGNRLAARGRGAMVIVASVAGYQATPHMALYGATKGFDLLLSEALSCELKGAGVKVIALCPGATDTEFQAAASGVAHAGDDPAAVVRECLRAVGNKTSLITGWINKAQVLSQRFLPRTTVTALGERVLRRFDPR